MKVNYTILNGNLYLYLIGELDECTATNTRAVLDQIIDKYPTQTLSVPPSFWKGGGFTPALMR